jgi:hypothetical protein
MKRITKISQNITVTKQREEASNLHTRHKNTEKQLLTYIPFTQTTKSSFHHNLLTTKMMRSRNEPDPLEEQNLRDYQYGAPNKNEDSALARKRALLKLGVATNLGCVHDDAGSKDKALRLLKGHVLDAIVSDKKNPQKWNFTTVPLKCFNMTMDDVLLAFLRWAKTEDENQIYDVAKAFARAEEYATWMYARRDDLRGLTNESIQPAWNAWNIKVSHDGEGRVVWWIDLASVGDINRELTVGDSLRLFVWFAHYLLFRHRTQNNGIVIVVNMARIDFRTFVSMLPPNLGRKLERLATGVLPIKIKQIYVTGVTKWCNIFLKVINPFLCKEMKRRIVALQDLEELMGANCVPEGFGKCINNQGSSHSAQVRPLSQDSSQQQVKLLREWLSQEHGTLMRPADVSLMSKEEELLCDWQSKDTGTLLQPTADVRRI